MVHWSVVVVSSLIFFGLGVVLEKLFPRNN